MILNNIIHNQKQSCIRIQFVYRKHNLLLRILTMVLFI